jgi:hypothetical protein
MHDSTPASWSHVELLLTRTGVWELAVERTNTRDFFVIFNIISRPVWPYTIDSHVSHVLGNCILQVRVFFVTPNLVRREFQGIRHNSLKGIGHSLTKT